MKNDTLLDCLCWLSKHYEKPRSSDALVVGIPGYNGKLSVEQFYKGCKKSKPRMQIFKN